MLIEFDERDVELLKELIEWRLRDIGPEIHHTRLAEYRERLKNTRVRLEAIDERLCGATPTASRQSVG